MYEIITIIDIFFNNITVDRSLDMKIVITCNFFGNILVAIL